MLIFISAETLIEIARKHDKKGDGNKIIGTVFGTKVSSDDSKF